MNLTQTAVAGLFVAVFVPVGTTVALGSATTILLLLGLATGDPGAMLAAEVEAIRLTTGLRIDGTLLAATVVPYLGVGGAYFWIQATEQTD